MIAVVLFFKFDHRIVLLPLRISIHKDEMLQL